MVSSFAGPVAGAASPDGKSLYLVAEFSGAVLQFDVTSDGQVSAKSPPVVETGGTAPNAIAVSPDGRSVYVTNSNVFTSDTVSQFDVNPASGALTLKRPATVNTGPGASGVAVSLDGRSVYVTNQGGRNSGSGNTVSQYDVGQGGVLAPKTPPAVAAGGAPRAVAVSPDAPHAQQGVVAFRSPRSRSVQDRAAAAAGPRLRHRGKAPQSRRSGDRHATVGTRGSRPRLALGAG